MKHNTAVIILIVAILFLGIYNTYELVEETNIGEAKIVAEKIKEAVYNKKIENKNTALGIITISIGVSSVLPKKNIIKEDFIYEADEALYKAKEMGRNRVCLCKKIN